MERLKPAAQSLLIRSLSRGINSQPPPRRRHPPRCGSSSRRIAPFFTVVAGVHAAPRWRLARSALTLALSRRLRAHGAPRGEMLNPKHPRTSSSYMTSTACTGCDRSPQPKPTTGRLCYAPISMRS
ncbi:hypothetical protein MRX96_013566 [Rhipicephalus microplus]